MVYIRSSFLPLLLPLPVTAFSPVPLRTLPPAVTFIPPTTSAASFSTAYRLGVPRFSSSSTAAENEDDVENWLQDQEKSAQTNVRSALQKTDKNVLRRLVRIGNHVPTLISLSYFTLISMALGADAGSSMGRSALARVLTMPLGSTSASLFSSYFPTLVTPPSPIFLVWPLIATSQLYTVLVSALRRNEEPLLSQLDLTALSLANLASAAWLFASSLATPDNLPLSQLMILPIVTLVSGYPLRMARFFPKKVSLQNFVYSLYSSFTTLASLLAVAVELQHGGRVPFLVARPNWWRVYSWQDLPFVSDSRDKVGSSAV